MKRASIALLVGFAALCFSMILSGADKPTKDGICEVHGTQMTKTNVPIYYGLLMPNTNMPPYEVVQKRFPHAQDFVEGGCIVFRGQPKTSTIDSCVRCREAKNQWFAARKK